MFKRRRRRRIDRGLALRGVGAMLAAMFVAALAVAGRAAGLYPRWVVFAIAVLAGACAGFAIRRMANRSSGAIVSPRRS